MRHFDVIISWGHCEVVLVKNDFFIGDILLDCLHLVVLISYSIEVDVCIGYVFNGRISGELISYLYLVVASLRNIRLMN